MVVLRTGKIIVVYRGRGYNAEQSNSANLMEGKVENSRAQENGANRQAELPLSQMQAHEGLIDEADSHQGSEPAVIYGGHTGDCAEDSQAGLVANAANARWTSDLQAKKEADLEAESILEGLGPRFENWVGLLPVPIDADLLPLTIPNYRPPFRLMPYGIKPRMSDTDVTELRRRARPLGPHFVLGRCIRLFADRLSFLYFSLIKCQSVIPYLFLVATGARAEQRSPWSCCCHCETLGEK